MGVLYAALHTASSDEACPRMRGAIAGVQVPCGKGIKHLVETELLYNEYIVYDVDQVRIRYLVKVRFDFLKK